MDKYLEANKNLWNEAIPYQAKSEYYALDRFRKEQMSLGTLEREELGSVKGKTLLHLQCHFGMDSLSWAKLGARVTGVDFSETAIDLARKLSEELNIKGRFICSDIYGLPEVLNENFDLVFTSYGVLCFLPDLKRWAEVVAHFLNTGGIFYVVDKHPLLDIFDDNSSDLKVRSSYFPSKEPDEFVFDSFSEYKDIKVSHPLYYRWKHTLSSILNYLLSAGLFIEFIHEFPFTRHSTLPFIKKCDDGWCRPINDIEIPLMFSVRALKK